MLSLVELKRRLENIVQIGIVDATKNQEGKALARVVVHDVGEDKRVTDFLPVLSLANSFFRVFFPIRVGEQVLVISLFGDANKGFILRSIFNKSCKEPDGASDTRTVIEFEDGTVVYYDTKTKILDFNCTGDVSIKAAGNINIEADGNIALTGKNIYLN